MEVVHVENLIKENVSSCQVRLSFSIIKCLKRLSALWTHPGYCNVYFFDRITLPLYLLIVIITKLGDHLYSVHWRLHRTLCSVTLIFKTLHFFFEMLILLDQNPTIWVHEPFNYAVRLSKEAFKYYISTLGVGGLTRNSYNAYAGSVEIVKYYLRFRSEHLY